MQKILGIRRENKNRWERRAPLTPQAVKKLRDDYRISFYVQPSATRIFPDDAFRQAGAIIQEDLSPCPVVIGIKETPPDFFLPAKTYVFFSHTTKGQPHNIPILKRLIDSKCNLIDYELITDADGNRLVSLGFHAGLAGMVSGLWALGQRFKAESISTPFEQMRQTKDYPGLDQARHAVAQLAERITKDGFPAELTPLIIGFTGHGSVSQGAQEIFNLLPHKIVEAEELSSLTAQANADSNILYKVVFRPEHLVAPADSPQPFDRQHYYDHPGKYRAVFNRYLPHLTFLVNCIFWPPDHPHLVTKDDVKKLYSHGQPKLRGIADISCDIEGSIECLLKHTDSGNPTYVYLPEKDTIIDGFSGPGPVILAVDNLPSEIPLESSMHFSNVLCNFIPELVACDFSKEYERLSLSAPLKKALILHNGKFTPRYEYMQNL